MPKTIDWTRCTCYNAAMNSFESLKYFSADGLIPVSDEAVRQGPRKLVFQMTSSTRLYAAKIMRDEDMKTHELLNKPLLVKEEFAAYKTFIKSNIGVYIPAPLRFSNDGLVVDWRNGALLSILLMKFYTIKRSIVQEFQDALRSLATSGGALPHPHMLSLTNIGFNESLGFWFASAKVGEYKNNEYHHAVQNLSRQMKPMMGV